MTTYLTTDTDLTSIANAIRTKGGTSASLAYPAGFVTAIGNISGGGGGGSTPVLQSATVTITPSELTQSQTVTPSSGYDGLSSVSITVNPISSTYVGSGISHKTSSDLSITNNTVTVPAGYYESAVSATIAAGSAGTPTISKTVANHTATVTATVTNTGGYIAGGTKTSNALTVSVGELASGTVTITTNSTVDVTEYASAIVNVAGGGTSNFITGTFTVTTATGSAQTVTLPYTGSGYPISAKVVVEGGAYNSSNTTWYNSTQRYAIGLWQFDKSVHSSAPSWTTSGTQNQGVTSWIYKNSTSSSTTYGRSSAMSTNVLTSSSTNAAGAGATCIRFKGNNKTLAYYSAASSYGLLPGLTYRYYIYYSS